MIGHRWRASDSSGSRMGSVPIGKLRSVSSQKSQQLQYSQDTRQREGVGGAFTGKTGHRGDTQGVSLCRPHQPFAFVRNGRTVSQHQLVPPILSSGEELLPLDHGGDTSPESGTHSMRTGC